LRHYLDSSAIIKLIKLEAESPALRSYLAEHVDDELTTSQLARVEVMRALHSERPQVMARATRELDAFYTVAVDRAVIDQAASIAPGVRLRSLDAIHVASAMAASPLRALVTYDSRMRTSAAALGLPVEAPAPE